MDEIRLASSWDVLISLADRSIIDNELRAEMITEYMLQFPTYPAANAKLDWDTKAAWRSRVLTAAALKKTLDGSIEKGK
jgi:glucose-6-phosphate dehydrogenase assembly protein OpcA